MRAAHYHAADSRLMPMSVPIASLPWYDPEPLQAANDALWQLLRERLAAGFPELPEGLDRQTPVTEQWRSRGLVISQACGLDLAFEPQLEPLLAPHFDLPDCPPGHYYSVIVQAPRAGRRAAVNSRRSHSGFTMLLEHRRLDEVLITGSHRASLDALRAGRAGIAAIDAHTWRLLRRYQPTLCEGLEIIGRSPAYPAPPWVSTAANAPVVRAALAETLADPLTASVRRQLGLLGGIGIDRSAYAPAAARWRALTRNGR